MAISAERGTSTQMRSMLVEVAIHEGVEVCEEPLFGEGGFIKLPDGRRQYFNNYTLAINDMGAAAIARNKAVSAHFLRSAGFTVPKSEVFAVGRYDDPRSCVSLLPAARAFACELGFPVVVKPNGLWWGLGVARAYDLSQLDIAFRAAALLDSGVLVQECLLGNDVRVVMLDGELVCAYERKPLEVDGDGHSHISALLNRKLRQLESQGRRLAIELDDVRLSLCLARAGLGLWSVLPEGHSVTLLDCANMVTGGSAIDWTESVHPSLVGLAVSIAKCASLRFCGVDLILDRRPDCAVSGYHVLEVNAAPGLEHYAALGDSQHSRTRETLRKLLRAMNAG
ncbi:MAG: hypothetical protein U1E29_07700 [Coriobacteriia bacterium]|nr:hypothetical protein [Coriobacteriia bacterium]